MNLINSQFFLYTQLIALGHSSQLCFSAFQNLQKSVHAKVFEDLVEFVKNAGESRSQEEEIDSKFRISSIKSQRDIPTACLVTGVNMPDHEAIFGSLVRMLKDGVTPHIAQLHSRNCTTVR